MNEIENYNRDIREYSEQIWKELLLERNDGREFEPDKDGLCTPAEEACVVEMFEEVQKYRTNWIIQYCLDKAREYMPGKFDSMGGIRQMQIIRAMTAVFTEAFEAGRADITDKFAVH